MADVVRRAAGPDAGLVGRVTTHGGPVAAALVGVYVIWGSTYLGNDVALESFGPLVLTSSRFALAGLLLLGLAALLGRDVRLSRRDARGVIIVGVLLIGAGSSLLASGQRTVDSGMSSLVVATTPLWVMLFGTLAGQRPRPLAALGVGAGFGGLVWLLVASAGLSGPASGFVVLLCSTLAWSTGSFLSQRTTMPADALVSAGWQMVVGGAVVGLAAVLSGEAAAFDIGAVSARSWVAWCVLAFVCTAIGFACYAWLLQHASLRLATTYAYVNPVVAVALGVLVLSERVEPAQLPGALLVLVAVAVVIAAERRAGAPLPDSPPAPVAACGATAVSTGSGEGGGDDGEH